MLGVDVVGRMAAIWCGGVGGRERASATTFLDPGVWEGVNANSEMNASWHCCRADLGGVSLLNA